MNINDLVQLLDIKPFKGICIGGIDLNPSEYIESRREGENHAELYS